MNLQEVIDAINEEWEKKLEKIRAEIEKLSRFEIRGEVTPLVNVDSVLDILDKYKAEVEPQESEDNK